MSDLPPYALVEYMSLLVQTISKPFEENGKIWIYIRKPNDPTTMIRVETWQLKVLKVLCSCTCIFTPLLNESWVIACPECGLSCSIDDVNFIKK